MGPILLLAFIKNSFLVILDLIKLKVQFYSSMEKYKCDFELKYGNGSIKIHERNVSNQVVFMIQFSDMRPPLVITRAQDANSGKFWTSIPEGRQLEADKVGAVLSEYFKNNQ